MRGAEAMIERLAGLEVPSTHPDADMACACLGLSREEGAAIIRDADSRHPQRWTSGLVRFEGAMVEVVTARRPEHDPTVTTPWTTVVIVDEEVVGTWSYAYGLAALRGHHTVVTAAFDLDSGTVEDFREITSAPHRIS